MDPTRPEMDATERPDAVPTGGGPAVTVDTRDASRRLFGGVLVVVFLAGMVAALFSRGGYLEYQRMRRNVARQDMAVAEATARLEALEARIEDAAGERVGWERLVRERLGWVRPDERVVLLPDRPPSVVER